VFVLIVVGVKSISHHVIATILIFPCKNQGQELSRSLLAFEGSTR